MGAPAIRVSRAEFTRQWLAGETAEAMALHFGCCTKTITNKAKAFKLPMRTGGPGRKHDYSLICRLYADGVLVGDIARAAGLPHPAHVTRAVQMMGQPRRTKSEAVKRQWLTLDQWHEAQMARAMAQDARAEQAAMINAEMTDRMRTGPQVGLRQARAA